MIPQRVVLDTNVLISALVFGGNPRQALEAVLAGKYRLILSEDLLDELRGVLEGPKFRYSRKVTQEIFKELLEVAQMVSPSEPVDAVTADPDDNRILECALAGNANLIVSGDPDLLELVKFRGISILSPAQFVREFLSKIGI